MSTGVCRAILLKSSFIFDANFSNDSDMYRYDSINRRYSVVNNKYLSMLFGMHLIFD